MKAEKNTCIPKELKMQNLDWSLKNGKKEVWFWNAPPGRGGKKLKMVMTVSQIRLKTFYFMTKELIIIANVQF